MSCPYVGVVLMFPAFPGDASGLEQRGAWLRAHTAAGAVVMSSTPEADYLYSGRPVLDFPRWLEPDARSDLAAYLRQQGVQVLIVASSRRKWEGGGEDQNRQAAAKPREALMRAMVEHLSATGVLN